MSEHAFTIQFTARNPIDTASGVIPGVTVAEIGIATGHFAFLDRDGQVLGVGGMADAKDFPTASKRIPLAMDAKSLETVVAAGQAAKRVKAREDHDDSVGARAGYGSNFRIEDGKAVCDMKVFDAYRNRGVFMETASQTPELIGLSGDFKFAAEVIGENAFMRVLRVEAVDIVDRGALTHAGLFRAIVDTPKKETPQLSIMAKTQKEPDGDEMPDLDAFKAMCEQVAAYSAKHDDFKAALADAIKPVVVPTPPGAPAPVKGPASNPDASVKSPEAAFAAMKEELTASFSALLEKQESKIVAAATKEFQQQMSALGIKPNAAPAAAVTQATEPVKETKSEDFLTLRASVAKEKNLSLTAAAKEVMREKPEVYRAYQVKLGILKA